MSIFFKDTYATLWDVKPAEKYTDLNISTSEKDKDGNYVNSSWYPPRSEEDGRWLDQIF